MKTKKIELGASVEFALRTVARRTDDLLSESALKTLLRVGDKAKKPKTTSERSEDRFQRLLGQLPEGIWTRVQHVIEYIETSNKRNNQASVTYSPLVSSYPEFDCCKVMKYRKGHIITGRDVEIEKTLLTLTKGSKRGVILVGEPGVGKTAIVNAINARLIERTVPRPLIGAQIINLDIPYVFTKYKDDPLGKIIKVLERASSYDKAILFIDEVHQLLGHKMNDVMKPYLTEKIRFIGSTTINEYHAIITDDVALERRFTLISVPEPSITKTISMVQGTKSVFEDEHKCTISDEVCEYAVVNGSRFLGHRRNPDKSLDLLDIACAIMNDHEIISTYDKKPPTGELMADLNNRRDEIDSMRDEPGNRVLSEHYINLAISSVTNIPFGEIKDSLDYGQVYAALKDKIFGQAEQLKKLANVVNIFKHVKYDRERPISVILTVGPRGVGKKSAAALLAKSLYGRDDAFIEFNMSGMNSEFMITELKGAPPGYVGYGKSGGLIKKIRNNPQSVVYFKGMNKADNTILQYLLEACRHGKIVDSAEREASLNNTVIVFSVTLDDSEVEKVFGGKQKKMGFAKVEESEDGSVNFDSLKNVVGESLYNSVDEVIAFDQLGEDQLKMIYEANVGDLLDMYDVDIDLTDLQTAVVEESKNGHDIISKLTSEVPKRVFQKLQKE